MNRRDFIKSFLSLVTLSLIAKTSFSSFTPSKAENQPFNLKIPDKNKWLNSRDQNSNYFGFLALGDMGTGWPTEYELVKLMALNSPQYFPSIILLGDIIYPSAKANLIEPNFIKPFTPLIEKGHRFYPILGNHDDHELKGKYIKQYFDIPDYYTFSSGSAQFWALNSNDLNAQQMNWFNLSAQKSKAKWKIVLVHHSPYCSGSVHKNNNHIIKTLCPSLKKYNFDLCLSGHNHLYERIGIVPEAGNCRFIVSGGGSAWLHKFEEKVYFDRQAINSCNHYLRMSGNQNQMILEAINLQGKVFDQAVLRKA